MDKLLALMGFQDLTKSQKQELTRLASETVFNRVMARLEERLSPEQLAEVETLFARGEDEQLAAALQTWAGLDLTTLMDEEMDNYAQEMLLASAHMRDRGDG